MDKHERHIRQLIDEVRDGQLPRRGFIAQMVGLGLTAPMAGMLLMHAGVASAQTTIPYKGTKRGGGGTLKLIYWQAAVQPALCRRHQGPGRQPHLLRAAGRLGQRRQPGGQPGGRDPEQGERRRRRRRQDRHLEAEEGRDLARRQALHRR
jgi:hypothetical protein